MSDKPGRALEQKKDRRGLLALIGAGGVAAVAALFSRNGRAEAGHDATNVFHLGEDNTAIPSAPTTRTADVDDAALAGVNTNNGEFPIGVGGIASTAPAAAAAQLQGLDRTLIDRRSQAKGKMLATVAAVRQGDVVVQQEVGNGSGVVGLGDLSGVFGVGEIAGVLGFSDAGLGVFGFGAIGLAGSGSDTGVRGDGVLGIRGFGTSSGVRGDGPVGVRGVSSDPSGIGVFGVASSGKVGVRGDASGAGKTGVLAKATSGALALKVDGRARFTNAGTATIPAGKDQVRVTGKTLNPGAFTLATIQSSPGRDTAVKWVRRNSSTSFTVVLTNPVTKNTKVGYFIVN